MINFDQRNRCAWCLNHPQHVVYHDMEWGVPEFDERQLFERFLLIGAHIGVGWLTILRKRFNFKEAFDQFDPEKMAFYDKAKVHALLDNKGIIRNKQKIQVFIKNAQAVLDLKNEGGDFNEFVWRFSNFEVIKNTWEHPEDLPQTSPESDAMSEALKKRGFQYAGSRICYAFMQSVGIVNDHLVDCWRYEEVAKVAVEF